MGIRSVGEARQAVHSKLLNIRNLFTVVTGPKFIEAWGRATDDQKGQLSALIERGDHAELSTYVRTVLRDSLGDLNVRELRKIAQECGVRGYNTLPKASLLSAISGKQNEAGNPTTRPDDAAPAGGEGGEGSAGPIPDPPGSLG